MADVMQNPMEKLYLEFLNEKKYQQRIVLFNHHFGIVPFKLPFFDSELSWFDTGSKTLELIDLFNKENKPTVNFLERVFLNNNHVINFNIKPTTREQRASLNQTIIHSFIKDDKALQAFIKKELKGVTDPVDYITGKISKMHNMLQCIREKVKEPVDTTLKLKFLTIFYKGYTSFYEDRRALNIKRRFVELYLYSQGKLFSNYQNALTAKLEELKAAYVNDQTHNASIRLMLLDKLGIIKHLKQTCVLQSKKDIDKRLAKLLCFIMKEQGDSYRSILAYLKSGEHEITDSVLLKTDFEIIRNELQYFVNN